jgi:hypothetical protein
MKFLIKTKYFMRKIVWTGLLFVICLNFANAQRQHRENDWASDGLQGKVKRLIVKEFVLINDTLQEKVLLESSIRYYNEYGYLTEINEFDDRDSLTQKQVFVYSKNRHKLEELLYDEDEKLIEKTISKLNAMGNPTQSTVTDARGIVQQKNKYEYDEKDRLTRHSGYDAKGKLSERYYYLYNEKGVLNQYLSFSEYENKKIVYKYDANKNPIEMMVYDTKTNAFLEKIVQKFDHRKNVIETSYWNEKNDFKSSVSYKYDEKDNLLEYKVLDAEKTIRDVFTFVYQYDTRNNWVSQTASKNEDKQITERIIEYYE